MNDLSPNRIQCVVCLVSFRFVRSSFISIRVRIDWVDNLLDRVAFEIGGFIGEHWTQTSRKAIRTIVIIISIAFTLIYVTLITSAIIRTSACHRPVCSISSLLTHGTGWKSSVLSHQCASPSSNT